MAGKGGVVVGVVVDATAWNRILSPDIGTAANLVLDERRLPRVPTPWLRFDPIVWTPILDTQRVIALAALSDIAQSSSAAAVSEVEHEETLEKAGKPSAAWKKATAPAR